MGDGDQDERAEAVPEEADDGSSRSRRRLILRVLAAIAVITLVLAWQADLFADRVRPGEVERRTHRLGDRATASVEAAAVGRRRELSGSLRARTTVRLAPRVSGRVVELLAEAGERVERGQVVAQLEREALRAAVGEADAVVAAREADLRGAEEALDRIEAGFEDAVASELRLVQASSRRDAAAAALERAREALANAESRLGWTTLRSPIDGVVIDTAVDPGDLAMPGSTLLTMFDPGTLEAQVSVPASLLGRFEEGERFPVAVEAAGFEGVAVVRTRVRRTDPGTRSTLVRLRIPAPESALPGMYVRLFVETGVRDALLLPESAIGRVRQLAFVWRVTPDGVLRRRLVRTGARRPGGRIEILAGLDAGDRVLAAWTSDPGATGAPEATASEATEADEAGGGARP